MIIDIPIDSPSSQNNSPLAVVSLSNATISPIGR